LIALDNGDKVRGDAAAADIVDYTLHGLVGTTITQLADGQLPGAIGDLYTAGEAGIAVTSIILVNTDVIARAVNLYLTPSGGTGRRLIPKDMSLGAGHALITDGIRVSVYDASGNLLTVAVAAAHKDTHDPIDGSDKLDTAAPVKVGAANAIGSSHSFARADHVHEREHARYTNSEAVAAVKADAGLPVVTITFIIDGGGSAITTGEKGHLRIPFACTINRVTMLADQSGSIVVDIWKKAYATFPPADGDSITAAAPPTITTAQKSQDSTLTDWTTAITAGDILAFNVDSITAIQRVTISLKVTKT